MAYTMAYLMAYPTFCRYPKGVRDLSLKFEQKSVEKLLES